MARLGYIEWNSPEELADAPDTLFADPEVRARFAALIARAAQNASARQEEDFSSEVEPASLPGDAP